MPPSPMNPYGQATRPGAYSTKPIAAPMSYNHVSIPTDVRSLAMAADEADEVTGVPVIFSDECEKPARARNPYLPRQYVAPAEN